MSAASLNALVVDEYGGNENKPQDAAVEDKRNELSDSLPSLSDREFQSRNLNPNNHTKDQDDTFGRNDSGNSANDTTPDKNYGSTPVIPSPRLDEAEATKTHNGHDDYDYSDEFHSDFEDDSKPQDGSDISRKSSPRGSVTVLNKSAGERRYSDDTQLNGDGGSGPMRNNDYGEENEERDQFDKTPPRYDIPSAPSEQNIIPHHSPQLTQHRQTSNLSKRCKDKN